MAQATIKLLYGPAYLASSAANIYVPASGIVAGIRCLSLANVTASAATYTLYIGATGGSAGGTEIAKTVNLAANSTVQLYFPDLKLKATQFLTGFSPTGAANITIIVLGWETAAE